MEYFEENKPQFASPEMVRARHILIKVAQDAPEEEVAAAQSRIEEIKGKLDGGADFAELAQQYSEDEGTASKGGDLGWFQRGQMVKEFEDAAFALEPGQMSDIIRSQHGFHIIKLEDRRKASSFEEVKDKVRSAYLEDQKQKKFDEWYEKVREEAETEIELPVLQAYMLEEKDKDGALAAYEELAAEGEVSDVYIPYYIARIYEEKLQEAQDQQEELKGEEQPDEQKLRKLEELIADYTKKAKDKLYETLDAAGGDAELFDKLIPYDDQNPNLYYRYAKFLEERGQDADAVEQLEQALELKPDHAGALILHADIMLEKDDYAKAIEDYNQALQLLQGDERRTVQTKLGQAYLEKEEYTRAEELFAAVLDADPENQQVLTLMGDLLFATGRFAEAAGYYERALRGGVKPELQVKLGNAYLKAENLKEAGEIFDQVVKGGSFYAAEAYLGRGDVHRAQGLTEKALLDYK
ncbi:MAG: tetratricopeptide repeat protein, partial [Thermoplasmata archaeon]|nr:tetratricopeptide repeat protein [Thermoplasmata archaeon]NIW88185.1 tetratricopeptide repeat protein [Thermoplasmata archaeon]NIY02873.1 tetratricopeptide repeat protein [Thermoplasmata archaeon]